MNKRKVIRWILFIGFIVFVAMTVVVMVDDARYEFSGKEIDQAIANHDFEKARALVDGDDDPYRVKQRMEKINRAQMSVMISDGDIAAAEMLSREVGCSDVFWDEVNKNINNLYLKEFRSLYAMLSGYSLEASYFPQLRHIDGMYLGDQDHANETNEAYMQEIARYNSIVLRVMDLLIFDEKTAEIKKILTLLKPEAIETDRKSFVENVKEYDFHEKKYVNVEHTFYDIDYKLENRAKKEALAKIKEAGIRL